MAGGIWGRGHSYSRESIGQKFARGPAKNTGHKYFAPISWKNPVKHIWCIFAKSFFSNLLVDIDGVNATINHVSSTYFVSLVNTFS